MTLDLKAWAARTIADPIFGWHCRGLSLALCLRSSEESVGLLMCEEPRLLTQAECGQPNILVEGQQAAFDKIGRADPPPGSHSFGALLRHETGIVVYADPLEQAQALAALERLIELSRPDLPYFEGFGFDHDEAAVTGNRTRLRTGDGREASIHHLEAGSGIQLLFLHTAGADSRQYLHQLADRELQESYRMMAFDMPWHGLSSGEGNREATTGYQLSETAYLDWCASFIERVAGGPVIIVGCSMGAAIAVTLTALRPNLVLGCIALEAPMTAPGRRSELLTDARIADSQHNPAYVRAMLGPKCPQRQRDEACAIYSQARPGIYMGDLAYYSNEYDGARIAAPLAKSGKSVALLTGSYDYSASPANTRRLLDAANSENVTFTEMPELGHFPMIEDPTRFRPHFLKALQYLRDQM
ncbi:MAG: alpha/beta hydrolase [Fimbriimonadaceae bacterium]|nr:alpha/beta hydrolase [Alphaproteobacteria bacterium]